MRRIAAIFFLDRQWSVRTLEKAVDILIWLQALEYLIEVLVRRFMLRKLDLSQFVKEFAALDVFIFW